MNKFSNISNRIKVTMAQIRTVSGDLEGNTQRILSAISKAKEDGSDMVILPELAITGYNCGMLFNQKHFIDYSISFLKDVIAKEVPKNLVVVLGFVDCIGKRFDGLPEIQNSAAVIQDGKIVGTYAKILLANGGHHDDRHYFAPGGLPKPITVFLKGEEISLGVVICEDVWNFDHRRNIPKEIVHNGAEVLVVLNQSYFYYGKQKVREEMYTNHAKNNNVYVISCSNVGVGDITKNIMIYDGGSLIVNPEGELIFRGKRFAEEITTIPLSAQAIENTKHPEKFEEIFDAIVYAQRELFQVLGFKKAQVHVSGGLDSSVTLPLIVEAMGAENVIAISNPSMFNSNITKSNAQKLCDALGVKLYWEPMEDIQKAFVDAHTNAFGQNSLQPLNISTFDAVGRTVVGIAASQHFKSGLVSTSNHTEIVLNWFSWHDISTAAVYAPLADLTKVEVFQMAKYINFERYGIEIVPTNLFDGTTEPGPELADAQHACWNYFVVSGICAMLIRQLKDITEIVEAYKTKTLPEDFFPLDQSGKSIYDLVPTAEEFEKQVKMCFERQKMSVYKAAQASPMLMVSPISRGFSTRETIINRYAGVYNIPNKSTVIMQPTS